MLRVCLSVMLAFVSSAGFGTERWQTLLPDAAPVTMTRHGHVEIHGAHLYYAIPGASSLILPNVSLFAPLQASFLFNAAVLQFLDEETATRN